MTTPDHSRLRVSSLQRDNAVHVLRDAAADGRLTFDELNERVSVALTAVTRGDLAGVLSDLVPADEMDAAIADPDVRGEGPGFRWDDPLVLHTSKLRDEVRVGAWVIPPFIEAIIELGSVRLNCVAATPGSNLIDISVVGGMLGRLVVVVPEGWGVDTQQLQASGSSASVTSNVPTRPTGDRPRILLRGRTEGSVSVRRPNWFDRRELDKAAVRELASRT